MSVVDWLLLGAVALAVILAVWVCIRNRKKGKTCNGDCANCGCSCGR